MMLFKISIVVVARNFENKYVCPQSVPKTATHTSIIHSDPKSIIKLLKIVNTSIGIDLGKMLVPGPPNRKSTYVCFCIVCHYLADFGHHFGPNSIPKGVPKL